MKFLGIVVARHPNGHNAHDDVSPPEKLYLNSSAHVIRVIYILFSSVPLQNVHEIRVTTCTGHAYRVGGGVTMTRPADGGGGGGGRATGGQLLRRYGSCGPTTM